MLKKLVKKFISLSGFQVSRSQPVSATSHKFFDSHVNPLEWLKEYKIATIIDVGANEGQFAEKIIGVFPTAQVHCFEPLEPVFNKLQQHFKANKNITLYNCGLGEKNEEKIIHSNEYSPSSSMLEMLDLHKTSFDFAVAAEPVKIILKRLDDVLEKIPVKPMLLKIDVQGYEMQVLKGGENILQLADIVILETTFVPLYKEQPLFADIYTYMVAKGFSYAGNIEQLLSPKNNQILQADAVFIKL